MDKISIYHFIKSLLYKLGVINQARFLAWWFEDLLYKDILLKNKFLKNIHEGERCFIIGNGLSVNEIDMSLLAKEYTFGSNFLNYHKDFNKLNINFYSLVSSAARLKHVDSMVTYVNPQIHSEKDIQPWVNKKITPLRYSSKPEIFFNKIDSDLNNNVSIFLGHTLKNYIEKNQFFLDKEVYYSKPEKPILEADKQKIDLTKRITFHEGVVFFMISHALYMGFKELYLIGCDYTYEPTREYHFYNQLCISKSINKEIAIQWSKKIAKANNFEVFNIGEDDNYYKPLFVKYNYSKEKYLVVKNFAESIGVKIYNIVPDEFKSPIYPGFSWDTFVKNVLKK